MKQCVMPAQGGIKNYSKKNINEFCCQSMIAYSIKASIKSGCFDRVIVSTDDVEIAEVAKSFGAGVPFVRPDELVKNIPALYLLLSM